MATLDYQESNFRFTDPIRLFKANDPYYFEVENIPLKQLQENCLWLKDQVKKLEKVDLDVKRGDLEELRPYANGGDRIIHVKPGRYTARINDASSKRPLAYLSKVMGQALGEVEQYEAAAPNPGNLDNDVNEKLRAALESFKSILSQDALEMNGLEERAFTWPVFNADTPVNTTGVALTSDTTISYGGVDLNFGGNQADLSPAVISQALLWAKSTDSTVESVLLDTFAISNSNSGWSKLPRLESYFIKKWRGVARLAIVDVDSELSIEVPQFDSEDFSYTNSEGTTTSVTGVQSRIDLVFIYSKPVDASGVNILTGTGKQKITKPQLGIVKGAGIRSTFKESSNLSKDYITSTGSTPSILASPGDQFNEDLGFTSASGNDIAYDIRGSFPAPDDIMNLAPLLSEKLESEAYELVGQSILPVAYVWVTSDSQLVLPTDVIDIRPFLRTAELAYNERAGIAAAFPQLSLANPAVGKSQLDYEVKRVHDNSKEERELLREELRPRMDTIATGYVFGGWYYGTEGALESFETLQLGIPDSADGSHANSREKVAQKYYPNISKDSIPYYPDWDRAYWCDMPAGGNYTIDNPGKKPLDYINTFISDGTWYPGGAGPGDSSLYPGSYVRGFAQEGYQDQFAVGLDRLGNPSPYGDRIKAFYDHQDGGLNVPSTVHFHYIKKKINFERPSDLIDYHVDFTLVNTVRCSKPHKSGGNANAGSSNNTDDPGTYMGDWVEKHHDHFIIYLAYPTFRNHIHNWPESDQWTANLIGPTITGDGTIRVVRGGLGADYWGGFLVMTEEVLHHNNGAPNNNKPGAWYYGNPKALKCNYPTINWTMTGIKAGAEGYNYTNLNNTNPTIQVR